MNSDAFPSLKVLTVDDNRTNLQILGVFLKKLGHTAIAAENGEVAVARFLDSAPDLVLMDIMMPVMDGLEATRRIRAASPERWVPIVFLSALDRDENLVGGLEAGGDDYLSKPINFVVLEAKMRSMQRTLALQNKVRDSLSRLRTISDNVLESIITIDSSGQIISCNPATEMLFGWTQEELIGHNVSMLMPEPMRSEHDQYIRRYVDGGPPRIIGLGREIPGLRKDGRIFSAELAVSEVRQESGRIFIGVIRDISDRKRAESAMRENAERLQRYHDASEAEAQLAHSLIERQLLRSELNDPLVQYWLMPAQNFSGDVIAACRAPDGRLYALLADATGHGLAAAISTIPLLSLFYRTVPLGKPLCELISEINQQLKESMPTGRFVAATFVCLDASRKIGEVWLGGMPTAFVMNPVGEITHEFASNSMALGILDSKALELRPEVFDWEPGMQVLLFSDGLLEAENTEGNPFGYSKLKGALIGQPAAARRDVVKMALTLHLAGESSHDDVSLLLLGAAT